MLLLCLAFPSIFSPISLHDKFYFMLFPVPITAICFWVHWPTLPKLHSQHSFIPFFHPPCPDSRRRQWQPTPVLLPGKSQGRRSLVGCSPWDRKELDTTEWLPFHFSLSCTGEGNGNPLQCSCLENPRNGGAWWAAVYGVTQSRTWLKRLSSSSSSFRVLVSNFNAKWETETIICLAD